MQNKIFQKHIQAFYIKIILFLRYKKNSSKIWNWECFRRPTCACEVEASVAIDVEDDADGELNLLLKGSLIFSSDSDFGWLIFLSLDLSEKKQMGKYENANSKHNHIFKLKLHIC